MNRRVLWLTVGALGGFATGCTGGLGHRSVATMAGQLPIPAGIRVVRFESADGTVEILPPEPEAPAAGARSSAAGPAAAGPADAGPAGAAPAGGGPGARQLRYQGVVRRGADNAEGLRRLEALATELAVAADPDRPDVLVLRAPRRPADLAVGAVLGVEVRFRLPADLAVEVAVEGSGHLTVENRRGDVDLRTGRGDLRLAGCTGAAKLETGAGMTIVYDHRGPLEVAAMAGDMQVLMREPVDRIRLVTGQGNIQCLVPPNSGFRVDARTEVGKVHNGFGFPNEQLGYSAKLVGVRGDGATEIVMRSSTGHLSLSSKTWD